MASMQTILQYEKLFTLFIVIYLWFRGTWILKILDSVSELREIFRFVFPSSTLFLSFLHPSHIFISLLLFLGKTINEATNLPSDGIL
jgi:hypothetical protein